MGSSFIDKGREKTNLDIIDWVRFCEKVVRIYIILR